MDGCAVQVLSLAIAGDLIRGATFQWLICFTINIEANFAMAELCGIFHCLKDCMAYGFQKSYVETFLNLWFAGEGRG